MSERTAMNRLLDFLFDELNEARYDALSWKRDVRKLEKERDELRKELKELQERTID